jgi:hypothetical protein
MAAANQRALFIKSLRLDVSPIGTGGASAPRPGNSAVNHNEQLLSLEKVSPPRPLHLVNHAGGTVRA